VARILIGGGSLCTAWRVGPDNRVFTNNHCTSTQSGVASTEVWFNYQQSSCNGSSATVTKVVGDQLLATQATLDYTLFTVQNFATISSFGYLGLDVRQPSLNEEIFIAGHPGGRQKELSVVSDQDGGGRCRVNDPDADGNATNSDAGYYCDTEGGSSGSPVIARSSNRAIALHHFGGCLNSGAKFSLIWPQVSSHFGGVVPPGDNDGGGGGNVAPVANFTSSASGLTVAFTDASTDSDGSIVSRSWNFGDGTTSTATNPSKTYAAAGTYTVTLTVTDDDGATHTKTASVTVGTSGVQTYTNGTDVAIPDNNATGVSSSIVVSGRTGNAPSNASIAVNIVHPYKGDLIVDLIAPDGSVYNIHNRSGGSADNVSGTFSKNLSTEALNGTWRLRAADRAGQDVGYIDTWSITF
jgi:PKD repeat protein